MSKSKPVAQKTFDDKIRRHKRLCVERHLAGQRVAHACRTYQGGVTAEHDAAFQKAAEDNGAAYDKRDAVATELRAHYAGALAEAVRLRADNEKLKAWRAGAGPVGTGRIGMGPPLLSDGTHPGPGKQPPIMCNRTSCRSPYCTDCSHGRPHVHVAGRAWCDARRCKSRRIAVACKPWPQEGTSP